MAPACLARRLSCGYVSANHKATAWGWVLTHNLLLRYEQMLERQHGVKNEAEDQRREKRAALAIVTAASKGLALSSLVVQARRTTQRSVKFIRWLRRSLRDQLAEATAVFQLKLSYAKP